MDLVKIGEYLKLRNGDKAVLIKIHSPSRYSLHNLTRGDTFISVNEYGRIKFDSEHECDVVGSWTVRDELVLINNNLVANAIFPIFNPAEGELFDDEFEVIGSEYELIEGYDD